jgi:hypothetical protein
MADVADGIHRLIEMLEERFGRRWATLALVCVMAGTAAWGIHAFVTYLVLPALKILIIGWNSFSSKKFTINGRLVDTVEWVAIILQIATGIYAWWWVIGTRAMIKDTLPKFKSLEIDVKETMPELLTYIQQLETELALYRPATDPNQDRATLPNAPQLPPGSE